MKRIVLLFLILMQVSGYCQNNDNSVYLFSETNGLFYIDADMITSNSYTVKSWIELTFNTQRRNIVSEHFNLKNVSHCMTLFEFDIKEMKYRRLVENIYSLSNELLIERECSEKWEYIVPKSIEEQLFLNVKDILVKKSKQSL